MQPAHTPYDGSAKPFSVGLKPLDPATWIEPGEQWETILCEKDRLFAEHREDVFRASEDSLSPQREVLDRLAAYLPEVHPHIYRRSGATIGIGTEGRAVRLDDEAMPPLERAARLVPEDLVIMQRHEDGWRLSAAALTFPSSWSLAEKFGLPLQEVHRHVPEFGPGTRNATVIHRIFDNLLVDRPVWRYNWSVYPDAELYHPKSGPALAGKVVPKVGPYDTFIRVERQTLSKLPESGAVLFTIRIHVDPLATLAADDRAKDLARGLHRQIGGFTPPQLAYKGLGPTRDRLLEELARIAEH